MRFYRDKPFIVFFGRKNRCDAGIALPRAVLRKRRRLPTGGRGCATILNN
ncbi:MAG: hypothetical protein AB7U73_22740 [Pirellulales bacterium]